MQKINQLQNFHILGFTAKDIAAIVKEFPTVISIESNWPYYKVQWNRMDVHGEYLETVISIVFVSSNGTITIQQ